MRYSTCCFYEPSSPDCWSPQERTEDTGRQVGISSLLMKAISSRISNNTQGRLVRLAIPKQKECTEQLYLLVGYCQDGSSRGATPTFPFLPGCGLVELLVCLCPQNMAPLTLLLSWHPEKPQCWWLESPHLFWVTPQQLMSNQKLPKATWTQTKPGPRHPAVLGAVHNHCCSPLSLVALTSASTWKWTKEFCRHLPTLHTGRAAKMPLVISLYRPICPWPRPPPSRVS